MRLSAILSEVSRNISTNWGRVACMIGALALITISLCTLNASTTVDLIGSAEKYQSAGGATLILSAGQAVDATACEGIGAAGSVRAAGALRSGSQRITFSALLSNPVPTFEVTARFMNLLDLNDAPQPGLLISEAVATDLSVKAGDSISTTNGSAIVGGVYDYPDDGRRADLEYAVLVPVADTAPFDECWISTWPTSSSDRTLLLQTIAANARLDKPADVKQLNSSLGIDFDGRVLYASRVTASAPAAAFLAGALITLGAVVLRRVELASARHTGVGRGSLIATVLIEFLIYWLVVVALAIAAVMPSVHGVPTADGRSVLLTTFSILGSCGAAIALAVIASVGTIRESQLFRLFKAR